MVIGFDSVFLQENELPFVLLQLGDVYPDVEGDWFTVLCRGAEAKKIHVPDIQSPETVEFAGTIQPTFTDGVVLLGGDRGKWNGRRGTMGVSTAEPLNEICFGVAFTETVHPDKARAARRPDGCVRNIGAALDGIALFFQKCEEGGKGERL